MAKKKSITLDTERAKQMAYILWKYDGTTQDKIAKLYDVSQSTINATIKYVERRIHNDPLYMMMVEELRNDRNSAIKTYTF